MDGGANAGELGGVDVDERAPRGFELGERGSGRLHGRGGLACRDELVVAAELEVAGPTTQAHGEDGRDRRPRELEARLAPRGDVDRVVDRGWLRSSRCQVVVPLDLHAGSRKVFCLN